MSVRGGPTSPASTPDNGVAAVPLPVSPITLPDLPAAPAAPTAAREEVTRDHLPDPAMIAWWLRRMPRTGKSKAKWARWLNFLRGA